MEQSSRSRTNAPPVLNACAEPDKVIWRVSDGRPGHDAQSKGLISALSDLLPCDQYDIRVPLSPGDYAFGLFKQFPAGKNFPDPDLIIGAGHSTHGPMLMARHARGGKTAVLMRPSLPTRLFNLCLIPEHDKVIEADNIIMTEGPLNLSRPSSSLSPEHGLVLIGGESKHFHWEEETLIQQLSSIVKHEDVNWTIADSRRTPESTRNLLRKLSSKKSPHFVYGDKNGPGILELLQRSAKVWVSEDSMSMIYEALSTGSRVGVLPLRRKSNSRLASVSESLANKQMITMYKDWQASRTLSPPVKILNESARCAKALVDRLAWISAKPS